MKNVKPAEEEAKIPQLRLLRGGKGPPEAPTVADWLSPLERGTAFACQQKGSNNHIVEIYVISFKHTKTVVLVNGLNPIDRFGADPVAFCKKYNLFEVLGKEEADILPEGEDNGSEGTLRPRDVANDADAP